MTKEQVDQELSEIFSDSPSEVEQEVELPSRGIFYSPRIDKIKIKPLLFEDEKSILLAKKNKIDVLEHIFQRCLVGSTSEFLSNMVAIDKIYLTIKLREISFSKNYKANVVCPGCNNQYEVIIGIDEIPVNYYDKDKMDPLEIMLPNLKKLVKVKVLRSKDEYLYAKAENTLVDNLWRFVAEIAGKTNPVVIAKALEKLTLLDAKVIIDTITLQGYGIDPKFEYVCSDERCQYKGILDIPLTEDFFTMSSLGLET